MINNKNMKIMSKQSVLIALLMVISMGLFSCVRERSMGCPEQATVNKINIGYRVTRMPDKVAMRTELNDPDQDAIVRNVYLFIFHDNDLVRSRFFDTSASDPESPQFAYSVSDKVLEKYKNNGYGRFSFYIIANVEKGDGNNDGASTVFHTISVNRLKTIRSRKELFSLVAESIAQTDLVSKKDASTGKVVEGFTATDMMDRYLKDLLMVGSIENVDMDHLDIHHLPAGLSYSNGTMTVDVPLKRLVSKVTFKVKVDDDAFRKAEGLAEGSTLRFEPLEWQVYRAPRYATLFPGHQPTDEKKAGTATDNPIDDDSYYIDSKPQTDFVEETDGGKSEDFSFYCLQNYKSPREVITANVDESRDLIFLREKQEKEDAVDVDNKPYVINKDFIYAPKNATYVRFTGHIVAFAKDKSRVKKDLVEVTYTIHLIDPKDNGELDPNNYNIEGNCNYTYNITITGYKDLKYEVEKGQGDFGTNKKLEENPGAEGNYYSNIQSFYVDAHYSKVMVKVYQSISQTESKQPFFVNTPFDYPDRDKTTGGKIDINWVHFMPVPKKYAPLQSDGRLPYDHVPLYPGDKNVEAEKAKPKADILKKKILTVDELRPYMAAVAADPTNELYTDYVQEDGGQKFIAFVAFIDEYYYYNNPIDNTPITDRNTFVNARPRKMWIRTAVPDLSYDRKTAEMASAIEIDQVAIQSIYDPNSKRAVGSEAYDETFGAQAAISDDNRFKNTKDNRYSINGQYLTGTSAPAIPKSYEYRGRLTCCIAWGLLPKAAADPSKTFSELVKENGWTPIKWSALLQEFNKNGKTPADMDFENSYSICDAPNSELGGWYGTIKTPYDGSSAYDPSNTYDPNGNYDPSTTTNSNNDDDHQAIHQTYLNCLARNRDNNGNGVIDEDEIRWVAPTLSVIEDMQISRYSYQRPEYRIYPSPGYVDDLRKSITLRYPQASISTSEVSGRPYLFGFSSSTIPMTVSARNTSGDNLNAVWIHELIAVSDATKIQGNGSWGVPDTDRRILTRCVRVLKDPDVTESMQNPFYYDKEHRVVFLHDKQNRGALAISRLPRTAYRNTDTHPVHGPLPPHSVFSRFNIPAMIFQIAKDNTPNCSSDYVERTKACSAYYENADKSDLGKWRVPNSCEMHYIQLAAPETFQAYEPNTTILPWYITCTFYESTAPAYVKKWGQSGADVMKGYGRGQTRGSASTSRLRCIRELNTNEAP